MNDAGDHTPNLNGLLRGNLNRLVVQILWEESQYSVLLEKTLDGQFSIEHGDHHMLVSRFERPIHHE